MMSINPFQPNVLFHIETSHLFCRLKQMTGFYMKRNTGLKYVNFEHIQQIKPLFLLTLTFYFTASMAKTRRISQINSLLYPKNYS